MQRQAADRIGVSERWGTLLKRMKTEKDRVVVHKLRGRCSHRRRSAEQRERIVKILSDPVYAGYGPTLASERLKEKHQITIGREALRQLMARPDCGLQRRALFAYRANSARNERRAVK
jgi:hypothetical protein